jgi:hypothetical protein
MPSIKTDSKILSLADEMKRFALETEQSLPFPAFQKGLDQWLDAVSRPIPTIAFYYFSDLSEAQMDTWCKYLLPVENIPEGMEALRAGNAAMLELSWNGFPFRLGLAPFEQVHALSFGSLKPIMALCLLQDADVQEPDWADKLLSLAGDSPWLRIWADANHQRLIKDHQELRRHFLRTDLLEGTMPQTSELLTEWLQEPSRVAQLQSGFQYVSLQALETLFTVFGLSLEQEERNLKGKKVMNQQQVIGIQTQQTPALHDLNATLKNLISQQLSQVEKGISETLENSVRPQVGGLLKEVEQQLEHFTVLEQEKGNRQILLKIPEELQQSFFEAINRFYMKTGHDNLIIIRDALKGLEHEIEQYLKKNEIPHNALNIRFPGDEQLKLAIESALRWDKEYEGTMARKGAFEYFSAMRKYQMLFFMLASTFGLTFLRNLRAYTLPLSILLLGFGGFMVWKTVDKENAEHDSKELDKAKESMRSEARRMGNEIIRHWGRHTSDYLRNVTTQLQNTVEQNLKSFLQYKQQSDEELRKKVQRQVQNLDNFEKKISSIARNKENVMRNVHKAKADCRQQFVTDLRNA